MKRKLLTLSDLYNYYCSTGKSAHFSAEEQHSNIVVQVEGKIHFEKSDRDTENLTPVILQSCHIDKNVNGSNIKESVMTSALPSFSNRPILGYIHDVDGEPQFWGHNMHLDDDDNMVYDEICVGVIPESCEAKLEYDEKKEKTYVVVKGYLFDGYTKATEILEREEECDVSVELCIRELSYNAKEKVLDIEDFFFSGVTILGKNDEGDDVQPGMEGSNIKLADFSRENNGLISQDNQKLIEVLEKLNETLSNFNISNDSKKGGQETLKLKELLEKYGKSETDITLEEFEGLSDEELEAKFKELFETSDGQSDDGASIEGEENHDDSGSGDDNDDELFQEGKSFSVDTDGNASLSFEISHEDIRSALYNLLTAWEGVDNEWYWIESTYDDYIVYSNYNGTKIFRQGYTIDGDNVKLSDERTELFKEYLTATEKATLDEMRSNYSLLQEQIASYQKEKDDAAKDLIFADEAYTDMAEYKDFIELKEHASEYSVEEIRTKADLVFAAFVKKNGEFSKKPGKEGNKVGLNFEFQKADEYKPYGTLFD